MTRILSFVLILILVFSCCMLSSCVYDSIDPDLDAQLQEWWGEEDINYLYCGTYGDSIALCITSAFTTTDGIGYILIEGLVEIITPTKNTVVIWNNGTVYELEEAYEMGLINSLDALLIAHRFEKEYTEYYKDHTSLETFQVNYFTRGVINQ